MSEKEKNIYDSLFKYPTEYIAKLEQENQKLKQWDVNKDSRNSRQRIANAKLIKENKELKDKYNKALDILSDYRLPCEDDLLDDKWCEKNCSDNYLKCWNKFIEDKLKELKGSDK